MSILVFAESADGSIKKSSLEAISYALEMGGDVTALALGTIDASEMEALGKNGAQKVLHVEDERLNQGHIAAYATAIAQAMDHTGAQYPGTGQIVFERYCCCQSGQLKTVRALRPM